MYTYKYPRPALTVDAVVLFKKQDEWQILLIERRKDPFKGKWALPGGFVNMDERLEEACIRELEEETGLKVQEMTQFRIFDIIDRDPRGHTVSVVYYTLLEKMQEIKAGDDAGKADWFSLSELPGLSFDHADIIEQFRNDVLLNFKSR
ncbi:MAG: NUDIX hydrolase [Prolixibacteraceae bacterium]|jgi:8-oxo-dGTP diphosphatase|nr:NUDIX hydrolase [Prolixibacteraceae bacterium]